MGFAAIHLPNSGQVAPKRVNDDAENKQGSDPVPEGNWGPRFGDVVHVLPHIGRIASPEAEKPAIGCIVYAQEPESASQSRYTVRVSLIPEILFLQGVMQETVGVKDIFQQITLLPTGVNKLENFIGFTALYGLDESGERVVNFLGNTEQHAVIDVHVCIE
ncbi:uncharacterized protein BcabD6B2_04140 [Babesia caballi]|uniref:Uncharacterized protein n=1 Tax=Babesia caballi TaxID=5871 RepID=A0AAV4LMB5_BABCB|nr:hypothetical protein BcabD6B2_04140 [Babesia caballi]